MASSANRNLTLPFELIEQIIRYRRDSSPDLAQLCCVTHTFFSIARPLLYRSITLRTTADVLGENGRSCFDSWIVPKGMRCVFKGNAGALLSALIGDSTLGGMIEEIKWELGSFGDMSLVNKLIVGAENSQRFEAEVEAVRKVLNECRTLSALVIDQGSYEADDLYIGLAFSPTIHQIRKFAVKATWNRPEEEEDEDESYSRGVCALPDLIRGMYRLKELDLALPWSWSTHWGSLVPSCQLQSLTFNKVPDNDDDNRYGLMGGLLLPSRNFLTSLTIPIDDQYPFFGRIQLKFIISLTLQLPAGLHLPNAAISHFLADCPILLHLHLNHHIHREIPFECIYEDSLFDSLPSTLTHLTLSESSFPAATLHRLALPTLLPNLVQIDHLGIRLGDYEPADLPLGWSAGEREQYIKVCEDRGIRWKERWQELCQVCE